MENKTFATDLITFYHPEAWSVGEASDFLTWTSQNPERFWNIMFETLAGAGVTGIELTFGPTNMESVEKVFGTPAEFRSELDSRGLQLISSFVIEDESLDWRDAENLPKVLEDAERRGAFLSEVGAKLLVRGLPMRKTFGERPPFFVDLSYMGRMADVAHEVSEVLQQYGIKLAFHTESNSSLWYERDIDLFMGLTDPQYVWLCPDSCHIALGGGDPVAVANRHRQRIALAHWKDASRPIAENLVIDGTVFDQQQKYMAELGTGMVDLSAWARAMEETPGGDIVMIELDSTPDPSRMLKSAVELVKSL